MSKLPNTFENLNNNSLNDASVEYKYIEVIRFKIWYLSTCITSIYVILELVLKIFGYNEVLEFYLSLMQWVKIIVPYVSPLPNLLFLTYS